MDRLVKATVKEVHIVFNRNQNCSTTFELTNLMHTMAVAVSITTTNPSLFSSTTHLSILPPLSTSSFTLCLSQPSDHPPLSSPLDNIIVKSTMLPTGKASQEAIRRLFSKPGPKIFKDAILPIAFVGPQVVEFLLSAAPIKIDSTHVLSRAISVCDESQLFLLLRLAVKCGNCHFASTLIQAGADVNKRDLTKRSLMSVAVHDSKKIDMLDILIDAGYVVDNSVDRLLHEAAAINRVDIMEILCLSYLDIDVNLVDLHGRTALHVAAIYGHVEVLQFLVSLGSDPHIADQHGWTPLHCASIAGHVEAVEFLLTCSVYVKYASIKDGKTAFDLALEKGHSDLYDMLHLGDALHRAARKGDVSEINRCLVQGAKINGRDQNGWTALHRAAFKGRTESVRVLLYHGANVDEFDDSGYTPLHRAVEAGHVQVALALIGHGAKANMKGLKGTMTFGEQNSLSQSFHLLDTAFASGINFFDSAEMYPVPQSAKTQGRSEEYLGRWIKERNIPRDGVVLATKVCGPSGQMNWIRGGPTSLDASNITQAIDNSLLRLQTDYIDLYQIHWPDRYVPMFGETEYDPSRQYDSVGIEEQLDALGRAVDAGKIRYVGLSNETPYGLMKFLQVAESMRGFPRIVSVQNSYNLLCRNFDSGLAECCHHERISLLAYSPLAMGILSGKYLSPDQGPTDARLNLFRGRYLEGESRYSLSRATIKEATKAYVAIAERYGIHPVSLAIAFVLKHPLVGSTIFGATKLAQLEEVIRAVKVDLSPEIVSDIDKVHMRFPNPCP